MNTNKVALLVHSCDRYELLYKGFEYFFTQNWDFQIPCTYYFATEEKTFESDRFINIKSGKGEWSNRLLHLLNGLEEDYVLYFQEDMWLTKPVDREFFEELFELTFKNRWQQVKLNSSEVFKTQNTGLYIAGLPVSKLNNSESGYLMSHQVTLWNKDFLKQQLKPNEHPWRNEREGTKRLRKLDPEIMHIDYFAENGKLPSNPFSPASQRSEYFSISVNSTLNENAPPFIQKLKAEKALASYAATLSHNLEHHLTHDGKPKPLKKDIFKRMKDWIKGK